MYAVTFAISAGVRMRFGILGCEVVRKTRMAVAVIPGVFAMSRNAGPISNILGGRNSESTIWQALQASRCERMPGREITVLRFRTEQGCGQNSADHRNTRCSAHSHPPFSSGSVSGNDEAPMTVSNMTQRHEPPRHKENAHPCVCR